MEWLIDAEIEEWKEYLAGAVKKWRLFSAG